MNITWTEKNNHQFLHLWITLGTLRDSNPDGRVFYNMLKLYCKHDVRDNALIPIVAKRGGRGDDFAVYVGLPGKKWQRGDNSPLYHRLVNVAGTISYGFKVTERVARYFFPRLSDFSYRS